MSAEGEERVVAPGVEPVGSHAIAPGTMAMLIIILLLGLVSTATRLLQRERATAADVDLSIPDWRPTPTERVDMARAEDARRQDLPPSAIESAKALLDAFERFNAVDLSHGGDRRSPVISDAHAEYRQRALDFRAHQGDAAFIALGQQQLDRFSEALRRGDLAEVTRLSGSYASALRASQLIDGDGKPLGNASAMVAAIGFLIQWCRAIMEVRPVDALLDATSREVMLRWKLAANPLTPPGRRQEVARLLLTLETDFPVFEALAARAAADGQWRRAAALYDQAHQLPGADRRRLRANLAFARARSAGSPPPSEDVE